MIRTTKLLPSDERPLGQRPDLPNWSENYCLQAYDPTIGIGFWLHLGLPVYDFSLWHDITIAYLPGGVNVLVAKGFGARSGQSDVSGSMLTANYDEASGDWIMCFRGAGQRADRRVLESAPAIDGAVEPFAFELRYRGMCGIWDLKEQVAGQVWSNAHWEQPCLVTGWVEFGGQRQAFNGTGIRDHSRGSRDFSHMGQHFWLHGQFPSGRAFGLLNVAPTAGQPRALSSGYLVDKGVLHDAKVVALPEDRKFPQPFEVVLEGPAGQERFRGQLLHDMPFSVEYPNEILFGYRPGKPQHLLRESQIRWEWNGEVGYGLGERTVTLAADGSSEIR